MLLTEKKFEDSIDKSIWVVANEQDLYFKQLFKILDLLGKSYAKKCYHLSYGYVSLTTGKMKSREGTVVDADDLLEEITRMAVEGAEKSLKTKETSKEESKKRARIIALSAIKFFLLKNDSKKDMVFDPKASVSLEGETGPYLQYSYARAKSILRKAKKEGIKYSHKDFGLLQEDKEKELISSISNFDASIERSLEELTLHHLAHNILEIAEKFNSFYHEVPVLKNDDQKVLNARLSLVEATSIILKKGLEIMDIVPLEEM